MPDLVNVFTASMEDLLSAAEAQTLYAVLDACDEPRVPIKVRELGARATSLYQGQSQEELWGIAPYLVQVDATVLEWIAGSFWKDPWGIFAIGAAGLSNLRSHFRKFLLVHSPNNEEWYFRFYDPRVVAAFLPSCDAAELADFFGPIVSIGWVEPGSGQIRLAQRMRFGEEPAGAPRIMLRKRG